MWFMVIAACLFIGGMLPPRSRDRQCGHRVALVNSLIASGGTCTRVAPASLAHTTPSSATPGWEARMGARRREAKPRAVPGFMAGSTARD